MCQCIFDAWSGLWLLVWGLLWGWVASLIQEISVFLMHLEGSWYWPFLLFSSVVIPVWKMMTVEITTRTTTHRKMVRRKGMRMRIRIKTVSRERCVSICTCLFIKLSCGFPRKHSQRSEVHIRFVCMFVCLAHLVLYFAVMCGMWQN